MGLSIDGPQFTATKAERALTTLLGDPGFAIRAAMTAANMADEDGAAATADAIIGMLDGEVEGAARQ